MVVCSISNSKINTVLLTEIQPFKMNAPQCCKHLVNKQIAKNVDFGCFIPPVFSWPLWWNGGMDFQISLFCLSERAFPHFLLASVITNENQIFVVLWIICGDSFPLGKLCKLFLHFSKFTAL